MLDLALTISIAFGFSMSLLNWGLSFRPSLAKTKQRGVIAPLCLLALVLLFLRRTQFLLLPEVPESWPLTTGSPTMDQMLWSAVAGAGSMHEGAD